MKRLRPFGICFAFIVSAITANAESSYDIAELYSVIKPASGTKAVGTYEKTIEVKYILSPTKVDKGKYVVNVTKIGDNLYQIKDTDICVETKYCHEWASYSKEVVLIIESSYGYSKGKIIFD